MQKTTVYLPADLKRALARVARLEGRSEAELIREAVRRAVESRTPPEPRIPLVDHGLGDPELARNVEDALRGFGRS